MTEVTQILSAIDKGDPQAAEQLLPLVYDELRTLAAQKLAHEKPGQTLQATALVHEAYLRLVDVDQVQAWDSRRHFFAAAAEAMRRILVEKARKKKRLRHGGGHNALELQEGQIIGSESCEDLLAVDEILERLGEVDLEAAELVKLRVFAGMTTEEAAEALGISARTAYRTWTFARAWLYHRLHPNPPKSLPDAGS